MIAMWALAVVLFLAGVGLLALRGRIARRRGAARLEEVELAEEMPRREESSRPGEVAQPQIETKETTRPPPKRRVVERLEIELRGWTREDHPDMGLDVILFRIRNTGNLSARDVRLWCEPVATQGPLVTLSTSIATLASGAEATPEDAAISIWWQTVPEDWDRRKFFPLPVRVRAQDATGRFHETDYNLAVSQDTGAVMRGAESIAPGVVLLGRPEVRSPVRGRSKRRLDGPPSGLDRLL